MIRIFSSYLPGKTCRVAVIVLILSASLCNTALGQDTLLNHFQGGKLDSLHSVILKQKRMVQVFLPRDYKPGSADKYDVLYVLDGGDWNTGLISYEQRFVQDQGFIPSTIIVSVMAIDRNAELTPTHLEEWKGSGDAKNFLEFLTAELIPYIDKNYPANGDNTLWGHSLSGMFAIYAMLNKPASFKSYIAVDPSCWWDNCLVPKMAAARLPALKSIDATLFIGGRDSVGLREMRTDSMIQVLKTLAPPGIRWKAVSYPGESHNSVRLKATYDGLKYSYEGFGNDIEVYPHSGIIAKQQPFIIWCFADTTRLHYTLDGTVPTEASPKAQQYLTVNTTSTVIYKQIGNRNRYNKMITRNYVKGEVLKPIPLPKNQQPGGFRYSYYEPAITKNAELKLQKPVSSGIMNKVFNPDSLNRKADYTFVIDGFMEAREDGYYMFFMAAGKAPKLSLGNRLLVNEVNFEGSYSFKVPLVKGFYPVHIEYSDKKDQFNFALRWLVPSTMSSGNSTTIPYEFQYGKK